MTAPDNFLLQMAFSSLVQKILDMNKVVIQVQK